MSFKILLVTFLLFTPLESDYVKVARRFIEAYNNYDKKEMRSMLHTVFTFVDENGNEVARPDYLKWVNPKYYLTHSKEEIISIKEAGKEVWVTVDLKGEYFTNIDAKYPLYIRRFKFAGNRIIKLTIERPFEYYPQLRKFKEQEEKFDGWHMRQYGKMVDDSLLVKRSREYYNYINKR